MVSPENRNVETIAEHRPAAGGVNKRGKMDNVFFLLVLLLLTVGLIMMFSASYAFAYYNYGNSYHFIIKQAMFAVAGIVIMVLLSYVDYHWYAKFHLPWVAFAVSLLMLVAVRIMPPMGADSSVHRWISFGPVNFQPSEVAKFAVILLFAYLIAQKKEKMKSFRQGFMPLLLLLALVCVLVVIEPHLSATIIIFTLGFIMMIIGGIKWRYVVGLFGIGVGGAALAVVTKVVSYASDRLTYWLDPWQDATGKGYQTIQSLLAIGSGGLWGRGLGQSRQKYLWVPEPQNDFIFSIVCEELGLIGALCILIAFGVLVWRGVTIARRSPDRFGALLSFGLVFQIGIQAALNILVVTNTIPNTGISLPFFSYGGTSLLMLLAEMGIVLSVSRSSTLKKR